MKIRHLTPLLGVFLIAGCSPVPGTVDPSPTSTLASYASPLPATQSPRTVLSPVPPPTVGPEPTPFTHTVAEGETLSGISLRYGVDLDDLLAVNPGIDPRFLSIGQELIIPGPEGSESQGFFPTPTPGPAEISQVDCFPDGLDGSWCLVSVAPQVEKGLEAVAVTISLFDAEGAILASEIGYSPLHYIPAGDPLPIGLHFQIPATEVAGAQADIVRAFSVGDLSRFASVEINLSDLGPAESEAVWRAEGQLELGPDSALAKRLVLVGVARGDGDRIVGYAVWQHDETIQSGDILPFSLRVFSLGPRIEVVDLLVQALSVSE